MTDVSRPTECEAMRWDGRDPWSAREIAAWVNDNGGMARYDSNGCMAGTPDLSPRIALRTINGWAHAAPGHYVVMGQATFPTFDYVFEGRERTRPCRDFYPCDPDTFEQRWAPAEVSP